MTNPIPYPSRGGRTHGVDVHAVAQELGGRRGHDVVHPGRVLGVRGRDRRVVAHLPRRAPAQASGRGRPAPSLHGAPAVQARAAMQARAPQSGAGGRRARAGCTSSPGALASRHCAPAPRTQHGRYACRARVWTLSMTRARACSARKRTPLPQSSSNVSPRMGLNGFQVRSLPPNGPMQKAVTQASLRRALCSRARALKLLSGRAAPHVFAHGSRRGSVYGSRHVWKQTRACATRRGWQCKRPPPRAAGPHAAAARGTRLPAAAGNTSALSAGAASCSCMKPLQAH